MLFGAGQMWFIKFYDKFRTMCLRDINVINTGVIINYFNRIAEQIAVVVFLKAHVSHSYNVNKFKYR